MGEDMGKGGVCFGYTCDEDGSMVLMGEVRAGIFSNADGVGGDQYLG